MYSGQVIDELIELVARVENHAAQEMVAAPEPGARPDLYTPRYMLEPYQQPALIGVA